MKTNIKQNIHIYQKQKEKIHTYIYTYMHKRTQQEKNLTTMSQIPHHSILSLTLYP